MQDSTPLASTSREILQAPHLTPMLKFNFHQKSPSLAYDDDDDDDYLINEMLSLTWNIYGLSALFGFQSNDKTALKLYGKRLREEVAANLPQENVAYSANVSIDQNRVTPNSIYLPPIKVDVYAKKVDQEDSIEKCIYVGLFFSMKTDIHINASNAVKLPLLLCRGTRTCMKVVHSTLSRMFDCLIIALPMGEDDLMWLLPIIMMSSCEAEYDHPAEREDVQLEYVLPELPTTDKITVNLRWSDLVKILDVIIENPNKDTSKICLTIEHIKKFRRCLYAHMLKVAGLQLGLCTLQRINVSIGAVMDNKMKIKDAAAMKSILLYMTEKALNMFHTLPF